MTPELRELNLKEIMKESQPKEKLHDKQVELAYLAEKDFRLGRCRIEATIASVLPSSTPLNSIDVN